MKDVQIMRLEAAINQARRFINQAMTRTIDTDGLCDRCECDRRTDLCGDADQAASEWRAMTATKERTTP